MIGVSAISKMLGFDVRQLDSRSLFPRASRPRRYDKRTTPGFQEKRDSIGRRYCFTGQGRVACPKREFGTLPVAQTYREATQAWSEQNQALLDDVVKKLQQGRYSPGGETAVVGLKKIATSLGIKKASGLRKEHLIDAIIARIMTRDERREAPKEKAPWEGGKLEFGKVYNAPVNALGVDPSRFQYKLNVNKQGVTEELKSVQKWNPDFAGVISVWKDPVNGKTYVVNGHHRYELADRLGVGDLAIRYVNAQTAQEARAIGALINIAGGRGTAIDAAKFLRDMKMTPEQMASTGVSLKGKVAEDAAVLTRLNDRLFDRLARGLMRPADAIAIAKHLENPELQDQLSRLIDKREEEGKDLSTKVIEEMSKEMANTPTASKTEASLFGDITSEESLFVPRNELKSYVRGELSREVNDFLAVASRRRAERVGKAGNVIDPAINAKIAEEAERVRNVFDTLVNRKGEISGAINEVAGEYINAKGAKQREQLKKRAIEAVRQAIFSEAGVGFVQPGSEAGPAAIEGGDGKSDGGSEEVAPGGGQHPGESPPDEGRRGSPKTGLKLPKPTAAQIKDQEEWAHSHGIKNVKLELVPVSDLKGWGAGSDFKTDRLANAVKNGETFPPLFVNKDGEVADGNHRFEGAKKAGAEYVWILREQGGDTIPPGLEKYASHNARTAGMSPEQWAHDNPRLDNPDDPAEVERAVLHNLDNKIYLPASVIRQHTDLIRAWEGRQTQASQNLAGLLKQIAPGELETVQGFKVRRTSADQWRIETREGQGTVRGDTAKIEDYIKRQLQAQKTYGKALPQALARASAYTEPSFLQADLQEDAARKFAELPNGTPVVSLEDSTYGRTGMIVKDAESGRPRVRLDGEDGYSSNYVEPLDPKLSWRRDPAEMEAERKRKEAERGTQGNMFEQKPQTPLETPKADTVLHGHGGNPKGWPEAPTLKELVAFAKQKLGNRYLGIYKVNYGQNRVQLEVRAKHPSSARIGEKVLVAAYPLRMSRKELVRNSFHRVARPAKREDLIVIGGGHPTQGPGQGAVQSARKPIKRAAEPTAKIPLPVEKRPYGSINSNDRHLLSNNLTSKEHDFRPYPVTHTDPNSLIATQENYRPANVKRIAKLRDESPILVINHGGKNYIEEGHHRTVKALDEGSHVPAIHATVGEGGRLTPTEWANQQRPAQSSRKPIRRARNYIGKVVRGGKTIAVLLLNGKWQSLDWYIQEKLNQEFPANAEFKAIGIRPGFNSVRDAAIALGGKAVFR